MAHKNTAKRVSAVATIRDEKGNRARVETQDSESLYAMLETMGYWWDSSAGAWKKGNPPSTSIFKDDEGAPTGIINIRLMGHPDDMPDAIEAAKVAYQVSQVSGQYPNRKGPGVRVYITALLKDGD